MADEEMQDNSIALPGAEKIRKVWHQEQWFYSVVDIIAYLTESKNPQRYWSDLKRDLEAEAYPGLRRVIDEPHEDLARRGIDEAGRVRECVAGLCRDARLDRERGQDGVRLRQRVRGDQAVVRSVKDPLEPRHNPRVCGVPADDVRRAVRIFGTNFVEHQARL